MKRLIPSLVLLTVLASVATGCVHEFPELPTATGVTLHLNFDTEMPLYKEVTYDSRAAVTKDAYDVRHIVSVHRLSPDGSYSRTADKPTSPNMPSLAHSMVTVIPSPTSM